MVKYKTASVDVEIYKKIKEIIKTKKYLYRNPTQFINFTLIEKLQSFEYLQLKEREIKLMEGKKWKQKLFI